MKKLFLAVSLLLLGYTATLAGDPILISHRGLLRHTPENTLPSFATCLDLGIGFELDIRTTKDGKLVVLHDKTLGRTTNGPDRPLTEFTWKEIKKLDAGSWFDAKFAGVRVPTLEETFALIQQRKRGRTIIALNVKDITLEGEKELVRLIEKYDLLEDSFAFDQSRECSQRLKKLNPKIRIGQNVNKKSLQMRLDEDFLDAFLLTFPATREHVKTLHMHGKQALFNYGGAGENRRNASVWSQVQQAGIDGMLTDYPLECRLLWRKK